MSLINQMLRDLEARQSQQARGDQPLPPGLTADGRRGSWLPFKPLVLVLGFIALGALASLGYKAYWTAEAPVAPADVAMAESAVPETPDRAAAAIPVAPAPEPPRLQLTVEAADAALALRLAGGEAAPVHRREGRRGEVFIPGVVLSDAPVELDDDRVTAWQMLPAADGARLRYTAAEGVEVATEAAGGTLVLRFTRPAPVPRAVVAEAPVAAPPADTIEVASEAEPESEPVRMSKRTPQLTPAERADRLYREALQTLNARDMESARRGLENALALAPEHRDARKALGSLLIGTGSVAAGEAVIAEGIAQRPGDAELRMLLARSQVNRGAVEAAIAGLESGLPVAGGNPDYRAFLGALYQRVSQHDAAIGEYRAALSVNPSVPTWWAGLGISLEAAGRGPEAAESYRRALSLPGLTTGLEQYIRQRLGVIG
jgi:MSHA biogenesis protein MshN